MAFSSVEGLLAAARTTPLWQAVLEDDQRDRGVAREHSWAQMERLWKAMQAPLEDYDPARRSPSGLSGGEGARLDGTGPGLCPPFLRRIIAAALKTGECNACMRRIVAAPTAGASGVLPAVLIPLRERDTEYIMLSLRTAEGIRSMPLSTPSASALPRWSRSLESTRPWAARSGPAGAGA